MNEIKTQYRKLLFFCAYLSPCVKIHFFMGLHHTKVGFEKLIHVAPIYLTAFKT